MSTDIFMDRRSCFENCEFPCRPIFLCILPSLMLENFYFVQYLQILSVLWEQFTIDSGKKQVHIQKNACFCRRWLPSTSFRIFRRYIRMKRGNLPRDFISLRGFYRVPGDKIRAARVPTWSARHCRSAQADSGC